MGRRNVRIRHLATPPTPSVPSGPRRSAVSPRSQSQSTPPSLDVPRNQLSFVPQQVVDSPRVMRLVMTKLKLLSKMLPRKTVTWSPRELASTLPSLFQSWPQLRSVLMSPRKSVPDQEPTPDQSRSQLSRNGVMFHLRNLVLPKMLKVLFQFKNMSLSLMKVVS